MSQSVIQHTTPNRAFTWRSIGLGLLSTAFVCAAAPFNDIVLSDTSLAAGYFPLASVLVMFVMIVCLNAPLHRWAPRRALVFGFGLPPVPLETPRHYPWQRPEWFAAHPADSMPMPQGR